MLGARHTHATWMTTRICLDCGYRGRELQGDRADAAIRCPICGADLYSRRARSYAEMEGIEIDATAQRPPLLETFDPLVDPTADAGSSLRAARLWTSLRRRRAFRLGVQFSIAMLVSAVLVALGVLLGMTLGLSF